MIDVTKASRETLEEFVAAEMGFTSEDPDSALYKQQSDRLVRARKTVADECAAPKLRSREQVDANIVEIVRDNLSGGPYNSTAICSNLVKLCAEPTTEEPAELDLTEHEVCGCEEAEKLKARVAELEQKIEKLSTNIEIERNTSRQLQAKIESARACL